MTGLLTQLRVELHLLLVQDPMHMVEDMSVQVHLRVVAMEMFGIGINYGSSL